MAVYSMTGFGSSVVPAAGTRGPDSGEASGKAGDPAGPRAGDGSVEIRSVNGRFLDVSLRLPDDLRGLEPALRQSLTQTLHRGKVEVRIALARESGTDPLSPAPERLMRLARAESTVRAFLGEARPLSVHEALHWAREAETTPPVDLEARVMDASARALQALREARAREGERLADILRERLAELRSLATQAAPLVPAAAERQRERFVQRWQEALARVQDAAGPAAPTVSPEALQERALAELAAQALRSDIGEELARLATHADEIERILTEGGEVGRKLDFLIQELHREANTLGSKSPSIELTRVAVAMKVAVEQMREQVQNLE